MTQDNSTDNSISTDASRTSAADDGGAAVASLTLAEINAHLGKDFKDVPTALKALQDTQSFVGKRREDIAAEVRAEQAAKATGDANASSGGSSSAALESDVKTLQKELFYTQNPQFKDMRAVIDSMGSNPAEVVETEAFKQVFSKVQVANEVEQKKSVVSSNSRLGQSKTHIDSAVSLANARGSTKEDVADVLAAAIIEETGMTQ
jgi:predicted lactoylglutathione lyase